MLPSSFDLDLSQARTEREMYQLVGKVMVNRFQDAFRKLPKSAQRKWRANHPDIAAEKASLADALRQFWDDVERKFFDVVADTKDQRIIFSMWRGLATWTWTATGSPKLDAAETRFLR